MAFTQSDVTQIRSMDWETINKLPGVSKIGWSSLLHLMTKLSVSTWAPVSKNNQWAEDWREEAASPDSSFSEFRWRNWGEQVPCRTEGSFGVEMGPICVDLRAQRERQRTLKSSTKCPPSQDGNPESVTGGWGWGSGRPPSNSQSRTGWVHF